MSAPTSAADLDPDRRKALNSAAARALVTDNFDVTGDVEVVGFVNGAAVVSGDTVWYLAMADPERSLGPALALARSRSADHLHVMVSEAAVDVARQASCFAPAPGVWAVEGRSITAIEPGEPARPPDVPAAIENEVAMLRGAGCEVVVEHGQVVGEIRGLEVARIVVDGDGPSLQVGVGAVDRDAHQIMYPGRDVAEALAEVVAVVSGHRRIGADAHPLNRLVPERWLRSLLIEDPGLIGAAHLAPLPPVQPRSTLKERCPALAVGEAVDGTAIVVACSVGVDVDVVPQAADARGLVAGDPELWLVLPARDLVPVTRHQAAALAAPARLWPVRDDWRSAGVVPALA